MILALPLGIGCGLLAAWLLRSADDLRRDSAARRLDIAHDCEPRVAARANALLTRSAPLLEPFAAASLAAAAAYLLIGSAAFSIAAFGAALASLRWRRRHAAARRRRLLAEQVRDLVEGLIQPLRAGLSLPQAFREAARELPEPIATEVSSAVLAIATGVSIDDALAALAAAIGSDDMVLTVAALMQQRRAGGNLPRLLSALQAMIADRSVLAREVRAMTAQGRLSGYIVASLPLAFLLLECVVARDRMGALFGTAGGWSVLAAGLGLEAAGLLWIRRICAGAERV
ncbi:MAG: type II secretion system F family protein [Candidatus Geothermincolia bacterium]